METTLAILLYLQTICTCTYQKHQMEEIIKANEPKITEIKNDKARTDDIVTRFGPGVTNIVIIDPDIE